MALMFFPLKLYGLDEGMGWVTLRMSHYFNCGVDTGCFITKAAVKFLFKAEVCTYSNKHCCYICVQHKNATGLWDAQSRVAQYCLYLHWPGSVYGGIRYTDVQKYPTFNHKLSIFFIAPAWFGARLLGRQCYLREIYLRVSLVTYYPCSYILPAKKILKLLSFVSCSCSCSSICQKVGVITQCTAPLLHTSSLFVAVL